jgi:hypothetical protein
MLMVAPFILFAASTIYTDASSLPYFNPQGDERSWWNYAWMGLGSIPRELGEKVLRDEQASALYAVNLVILVNAEYTFVLNELRNVLSDKMGIAREMDGVHGNLGERHPWKKTTRERFDGAAWPPLGVGLVAFQSLGMRFDPPIESVLMSRPYNRTEKVTGFSELSLRISDGRGVFGKTVTVIQMTRHDSSKEWFKLGHLGLPPIPLPFKVQEDRNLVTDTEIALIEQLKNRLPTSPAVRYFVPYPGNRNESYGKEFVSGAVEAVKHF